jgi:hypothetical protein
VTLAYTLFQNAEVEIGLYNYQGDCIRNFTFQPGEEGGRGGQSGHQNSVLWDGRDGQGRLLADGGSLCRIKFKFGDGAVKLLIKKIAVINKN